MMSHPDPERLVLLALGEQTESWADDTLHVAGCRSCRDETLSLRAAAGIAAEALHEQPLPPVSEAVWDRIAAQTAQTAETHAPGIPSAPEPASLVRLPGRGRGRIRRAAVTIAAAAAGVAATIAVLLTTAPTDKVVARVHLVAQGSAVSTTSDASVASGTVTFLDRGDGRLIARVAMSDVPTTNGVYEVWMYDGHTTMVPLGVTDGAMVELPVPTSVSLRAFPVVDVSAQRLGQQEYGVSILRGAVS